MVFNRNINGIDQCDPPICPDNIQVEITDVEFSTNFIIINWTIVSEGSLVTPDSGYNVVKYSFDNISLNSNISSSITTQPYSATISFPVDSYSFIVFQIAVRVDGTYYFSKSKNVSLVISLGN